LSNDIFSWMDRRRQKPWKEEIEEESSYLGSRMLMNVVQCIWEDILGRPWKKNFLKKIEMNIRIRCSIPSTWKLSFCSYYILSPYIQWTFYIVAKKKTYFSTTLYIPKFCNLSRRCFWRYFVKIMLKLIFWKEGCTYVYKMV
jgi:hypothetical protein